MGDYLNIYCEFGFLQKFIDSSPKFELGKTNNNHKYWYKYLDLFCGNSNMLLIDIEKDLFVKQCNDENMQGQMLSLLLNTHADGIGCLECLPQESKNMDISINDDMGEDYFRRHEHTVFLLDKNKELCKEMEEDYGLIFISSENIYDYSKLLFIPDIQEINEHSILWTCISNYIHPCNTIVLIDGYITNETDDIIDKNLNSIFNTLLPTKLNKSCFNIYIFTQDDYDSEKNKNKKILIENVICSLREYQINVNTIFEHKLEHDRHLFTNYCLFSSGYGFVLKESQRKIGTHLTFFPICSTYSGKNNAFQIVQNLKKKKFGTSAE
ncbi:hypothetical protein EZS27_023908 [termite gut metagenome]|uniref:Uncharacterized protein n=1 Tax=termite gut metagenome TaxID=433724 RepID=A0A5J4QZB9_9ZZZZ